VYEGRCQRASGSKVTQFMDYAIILKTVARTSSGFKMRTYHLFEGSSNNSADSNDSISSLLFRSKCLGKLPIDYGPRMFLSKYCSTYRIGRFSHVLSLVCSFVRSMM